MEQDELLQAVVAALERHEIPYFVTGSIATIFYGAPRFTNDIDIVVLLSGDKVDCLTLDFPAPDYYLDPEAARAAVSAKRQFNLIRPASGLKVDLFVAEESEFNRTRFARAVRISPGPDFDAFFASAEDVILMKLDYHLQGGSDRHLRDVLGVLAVQGDSVDRDYIGEWAGRLELDSVWQEVLKREGTTG